MSNVFWKPNSDGDYGTVSAWSGGAVPTSSDSATINTTDPHTITDGTTVSTVGNLTVGNDAFAVTGGSLTVAGVATFSGLLTISGGTLSVASGTAATYSQSGGTLSGAKLTVTGIAMLGGGGPLLMTGTGTTLLQGATTSTAGLAIDGGRILENQGSFSITGGSLNLGTNPYLTTSLGGGTLRNDAGATLTIETPADFQIGAGAGTTAVTNAGILVDASLATTTRIRSSFSSTGTVTVQAGAFELDGASTLAGTLNGGGAVTLGGSSVLSTLTIGGSLAVTNATMITQKGQVTLGDATAAAATLTTLAKVQYNILGDVGIGAGSSPQSRFVNAGALGKLSGSGTSLIDATMTDTGSIRASTGVLEFRGVGDSIKGALVGTGTIAFGGGGSTLLGVGTSLSVAQIGLYDTATVTLGLSLSSAGSWTQTGGTLALGGFILTQTGAATFRPGASVIGPGTLVTAGATSIAGLSVDGGATLKNTGTTTQTATLTLANASLLNASGATFDIVGDIDIDAGATGTPGLVNQGTMAKASGSGVSLIYVSMTDTGTLSVDDGYLRFYGARNSFAGTYTGPGMVDYGSVATLGAITMIDGACSTNFGVVTQNATVTMDNGSTLTNLSGATWKMTGNATIALASGASSPILGNYGTLAKVDAGGTGVVGISINSPGLIALATGASLSFTGPVNTFSGKINGAGTARFGGGGSDTFSGGAIVTTAGWTIADSGTVATLGTSLYYTGAFTLTTAELDLGASLLTLAGTSSLGGGALVDDPGTLANVGAATIDGLTLAGGATLKNNGTITQTGALTLAGANVVNGPGHAFNLAGDVGIALGDGASSFNNSGSLVKTAGVLTSLVAVNLTDTGGAGVVEAASGTLELGGTLTGRFALKVDAGTTLILDQAATAGATANLNGTGATLQLNDAQQYQGAIAGFGAGESLDLRSIGFGAGITTTLGFSGGNTSGTLTVSDGTHTAALKMTGAYTPANFHMATDSNGGTAVSFVPPRA